MCSTGIARMRASGIKWPSHASRRARHRQSLIAALELAKSRGALIDAMIQDNSLGVDEELVSRLAAQVPCWPKLLQPPMAKRHTRLLALSPVTPMYWAQLLATSSQFHILIKLLLWPGNCRGDISA